MIRPIAIDPPGCGCTECLTGQYVPLDAADAGTVRLAQLGFIRDNTSGELPALSDDYEAGRLRGIRDAARYINRVGQLPGSNEQRLKMMGAPELLRELADAVEAGVVKL